MKGIKWYCYILVMFFIIFMCKDSTPIEPLKHPYPIPVVTFYDDIHYEGDVLILSPGKLANLSSIRKTSGGDWSKKISSHSLYPRISSNYILGPLYVTIYIYSEPNFQGSAKCINYYDFTNGHCDTWTKLHLGFLGVGGNWDNKTMSLEVQLNNVEVDNDCIIFDN